MRRHGSPSPWSNLMRYGLALVAIAVALAARVALQPVLQGKPHPFFASPCWWAGRRRVRPATALGLARQLFRRLRFPELHPP